MMISLVLAVVLAFWPGNPWVLWQQQRQADRAERAFAEEQYQTAAQGYAYLADSLQVDAPALRLNQAQSLMAASQAEQAAKAYEQLTGKGRAPSVAQNQLGLLDYQAGDMEAALAHFRQAIVNDPTNAEAKYNYELVKRLQQEQEQQEQQDQDQSEENQEDQEQQDQDQQENEQEDQQDGEQEDQQEQEQPTPEEQQQQDSLEQQMRDQLDQMNLTLEEAQMILEAMRAREEQYLQERRRGEPEKSRGPQW